MESLIILIPNIIIFIEVQKVDIFLKIMIINCYWIILFQETDRALGRGQNYT